MTTIKPDAATIMAVHRATGLPVIKAQHFIESSRPELIQRILEGRPVRHITHLTQLSDELTAKIIEASDSQFHRSYLQDPIEDDPVVGAIVRRVLDAVSQELETVPEYKGQKGLCHLIWKAARERLLKDHDIVWYSPAEMNPGCCFD